MIPSPYLSFIIFSSSLIFSHLISSPALFFFPPFPSNGLPSPTLLSCAILFYFPLICYSLLSLSFFPFSFKLPSFATRFPHSKHWVSYSCTFSPPSSISLSFPSLSLYVSSPLSAFFSLLSRFP